MPLQYIRGRGVFKKEEGLGKEMKNGRDVIRYILLLNTRPGLDFLQGKGASLPKDNERTADPEGGCGANR